MTEMLENYRKAKDTEITCNKCLFHIRGKNGAVLCLSHFGDKYEVGKTMTCDYAKDMRHPSQISIVIRK